MVRNKLLLDARLRRLPVVLSVVVICLMLVAVSDRLYPLNLVNQKDNFARIVVDRDGEPLRAFADANGVWRYPVQREQVSEYYLDALLNYEDRWFFYHPGVNPFSLTRAAFQNLKSGRIVSGGSTITMQVARLLHPHSRTLRGKAQQMLRALQLEWHLSKNEILELYLNYAPFGGAREGVQSASYQYLGKSVSELTRAEAALLAVLPQAPSRLRPDRYPRRAQLARDKVLNRLMALNIWSQAQVIEAKKEQVSVYSPVRPMLAPLLARRLISDYPGRSVIRTSIIASLQEVVQDLSADYALSLPRGTSTAILVVDNQSHQAIAYSGSADINSELRFGYVDMVRAIRSPGSTLKPLLYGLAIDAGLVHSASLLSDVPRDLSSYSPDNFSKGFRGPVSLSQALQDSLNIPAVEVLEHYGPRRFAGKLSNVGIKLRLPADAKPNLSVILGGTGLSLENLVQVYGAFSSQGKISPIKYLADDKEYSIEAANPRYLMSEGAAWVIGRILQDIRRPDRVASNAIIGHKKRIAWKSGTSYGFRDAWSVGFNAKYTVGVWVGRPDGTPLPGFYGALSAAPLMFSTFDLLQDTTTAGLQMPKSIEQIEICWPLGIAKSAQPLSSCHYVKKAWVVDGVVPPGLRTLSEKNDWFENPYSFWVSAKTGLLVDSSCKVEQKQKRQVALWPKKLEPWIAGKFRRESVIPLSDPDCPHPVKLDAGDIRITGIKDNSIFRSAGSSNRVPVIRVKAIGGQGAQQWYLNGELIKVTRSSQSLSIELHQLGEQQLAVIDEAGNFNKLDLELK